MGICTSLGGGRPGMVAGSTGAVAVVLTGLVADVRNHIHNLLAHRFCGVIHSYISVLIKPVLCVIGVNEMCQLYTPFLWIVCCMKYCKHSFLVWKSIKGFWVVWDEMILFCVLSLSLHLKSFDSGDVPFCSSFFTCLFVIYILINKKRRIGLVRLFS